MEAAHTVAGDSPDDQVADEEVADDAPEPEDDASEPRRKRLNDPRR